MKTPHLTALTVAAALLAGLVLSGATDVDTSDYDYRRAAPKLTEIVVPVEAPIEAPTVTGPGMVGVYGG